MAIFTAPERAESIWGRLLMVAFFASYAAAAFIHESLMPILAAFIFLVVVGIVYYAPLRFIYWLFTGDGEIKHRFLAWLPLVILTLLGIGMIFSPPPEGF